MNMLPEAEAIYHTLTAREKQALIFFAKGFTTKEVAALMDISSKTADQYRWCIYSKLSIHRTVHLTRYAIRAGLIEA